MHSTLSSRLGIVPLLEPASLPCRQLICCHSLMPYHVAQIPSLAELWWVGTLATLLAGGFCALTLIMGSLAGEVAQHAQRAQHAGGCVSQPLFATDRMRSTPL